MSATQATVAEFSEAQKRWLFIMNYYCWHIFFSQHLLTQGENFYGRE
jgi:hypothetical protein